MQDRSNFNVILPVQVRQGPFDRFTFTCANSTIIIYVCGTYCDNTHLVQQLCNIVHLAAGRFFYAIFMSSFIYTTLYQTTKFLLDQIETFSDNKLMNSLDDRVDLVKH